VIEVYGLTENGRPRYLGEASSFGEARRMQHASLPADLKDAYAGIHDGMPVFYTDMLSEALLAKYPQLAGED
jgi:hypothetical protein